MGVLRTLGNWATDAWHGIFGAASDVVTALRKLWSYITALHGLFGWVTANPILEAFDAMVGWINDAGRLLYTLGQALGRVAPWIWAHWINPVYRKLLADIAALKAWTTYQLATLKRMVITLYFAAEAYTRMLVSQERNARITAVKNEHAAMLAQIRALHATVEKEAASGYTSGTAARKSLIQQVLTDLTVTDPAVKQLVSQLVRLVVDVDTIDNPVIRFAAGKLLSEIAGHLGIDSVVSDLIGRLLAPLIGDPHPAGLYDVEKDVAGRLSALEAQWAQFMTDGGPDLEQAGRGWKDVTSLGVDVAVLAFFGMAVRDPAAWSTAVHDTIGTAAGDAMTGIVDLIHKA